MSKVEAYSLANKDKTVCFTGHRNIPEINMLIKNRLNKVIEKLIERGKIYFGNGGALGFDTLAALSVLELKEKYPHINLIMVLPFPGQCRTWSEKDRRIYTYIIENADKKIFTSMHYHKACFHVRNRHLVDNSSCCIAYLNKNSGGTAYTVEYASKNGLEVINIAEKML